MITGMDIMVIGGGRQGVTDQALIVTCPVVSSNFSS